MHIYDNYYVNMTSKHKTRKIENIFDNIQLLSALGSIFSFIVKLFK
jgi:hypothetical protein